MTAKLIGEPNLASLLLVRDQDHLAVATDRATGRKYTYFEAVNAFGHEVIDEIFERGVAVLAVSSSEPSASLKMQRERLGLTIRRLAKSSGVTEAEVRRAEDPTVRSPIRILEHLAASLALDERLLAFRRGSGGDADLAVRLKRLTDDPSGKFSENTVVTLARAAWVIRVQCRMQRYFEGPYSMPSGIRPDEDYGHVGSPAWERGFFLARLTRKELGIKAHSAIESLRSLCFRLRIPLVSVELPASLAGATIAVDGDRGIVVNTAGANENVWVRRATIAHELAHLLWDPDPRLTNLRVDAYGEIDRPYWAGLDTVEARANAFAIEFLAPGSAALQVFNSSESRVEGLSAVMDYFGVSVTAARQHLTNILGNSGSLKNLWPDDSSPGDEWVGKESFTNDFFPIRSTGKDRCGEFAGWVVAAQRAGFISKDSAAEYLQTDLETYLSAVGSIEQIFPELAELGISAKS